MKQFLIPVLLIAFANCCFGQNQYYPGKTWNTKSPAELNLNNTLIDSAVRLAVSSENSYDRDLRVAILKSYIREPDYKIVGPTKERGGPAGMIIKNGYIVAQWGDINRVDMTFSVTKSFLSTVAGLAVDAKLITDVNDYVGKYVWDNSFTDPHNKQVTWKHLLQQNSDWSGTLFGLHDWADRPPNEGSIEDWRNRKLLTPGSTFDYNDVRVNLLAYSLLQVWRKPLPVVLKEKIMDKIDASTMWRWYGYDNSFVNIDGLMMQSVSGGGHHGGGMFINASDMARFGLLFLRNGKWNNEQLISTKWIDEARQPSTPNKDYGYMWWLNTSGRWAGVDKDVYSAQGAGGNYIIVDKANDVVIVTRWMMDNKMGEFVRLVQQAARK